MKSSISMAVLLLSSVAFAPACLASTPPVLMLSDGSNVITIDSTGSTVFSGIASCIAGVTCSSTAGYPIVTAGTISWSGKIGAFSISFSIGTTKPNLVSPTIDISTQGITTGATGGTLAIKWTDINFTGSGPASLGEGGTLLFGSGSYMVTGYFDAANIPFGTGTLVGTLGPFTTSSATTLAGPNLPSTPFSMTEVLTLTLGPNSGFSSDDLLSGQPPSSSLSCRMTGGGVDTSGNWDHTLVNGQMVTNGAGHLPAGIDRYTFGGQVGAPTASQPQPYGEWEHHQQTGPNGSFDFHTGTASAPPGTRIVNVRCSDPGFCDPARPAPNKQIDWDAIGTFQNLGTGNKAPNFQLPNANVVPEPNGGANKPFTYHWVQVNVDDLGEPGNLNSGAPDPVACPGRGFGEKSAGPYVPDPVNAPNVSVNLPYAPLANCICPDFYRITIYNGVLSTNVKYLPDGRIDPTSLDQTNVLYEVFGYIDGGNLQIHPAIN